MALDIGIDLGTSGCRAIAINENREIVAQHRTPLPASNRHNNRSEQNPQDWWDAVCHILPTLLAGLPKNPAHTIRTLSVDGTSATLLLADRYGSPLTTALMYNDQRAIQEAATIQQLAPAESGAHGPAASLAKLLWLLNHYPSLDYSNGVLALHQADWISNRLCNHFGHSDENNALKLGYDPVQRRWPQWINQLNLPQNILPQVATPGTPYSTLTAALFEEFGFSRHQQQPVEVCHGTTDSIAATIAAGVEQAGQAVTSLGTTLVLKILSSTPLFAPEYGIYSHRIGNQWLISGASNAGAGILLDYFTPQEIIQLSQKIVLQPPTQLNYYPLSSVGERFPINDPTLQPRLSPRPPEDHRFLQAILEGLTAIEQMGYRKMVALGAPQPLSIATAGGGSQNEQWTTLRQQQLKVPVFSAETPEAAYGCAQLYQIHQNRLSSFG
ncbi:MAG: FGGY-family carbohydrate kinase [Gammaproteobacteria bacterium]|jgi:hypothetical protein|nr:FGGY-family carbohydrate kinase [Gammaproteobacteria bacterium]MBT3490051.1 FGGY-family carbohydrate kinase [Gammaproteobacteria bacterium]MBT3719473.1 FGGY-family carbohydrate kinase [Gammaproteobacteria bacterium]MBT3843985.1 FGGY-family carbohydrate kinase [Gammaproteobacteria bacterium]MBT3894096.1 FGGY-family carbohydrate kinase [Gammaproteobacteria bacterium]